MVILIGAESLSGKTLMAQTLLERYRIPYLSADHIKMGLYRGTPSCGFAPTDSDDIIEQYLWLILKGIAETNIENGQSIIIEGCYISPGAIRDFTGEYARQVIPVFFGFSRQYLERHFVSAVLGCRDVIERRIHAEERTLPWFIAAHERRKALCARHGVRYHEINGDYAEEIQAVHRWIAGEAARVRGQ